MLSTSLLNSLDDRQVVDLALGEKLNFALFKLPRQSKATMYISGGIDTDISSHDKAFVIAPFRNDRIIEIPGEYCREMQIAGCASLHHGKSSAISEMPQSYSDSVSRIAARLSEEGGKTVLATVHDGYCPHTVYDAYMRLAYTYPEAFVFCWMLRDEPHIWMGASPELLMETDGGKLRTMALAGTRGAEIDGSIPWDSKNIEEQQMVTSFISQVMRRHGLNPETATPYTKRAGNIAHICTEIAAETPSGFDLRAFLNEMAPTPAVSGFPRETALNEIGLCEDFDREYYSGFCGVKSEAYARLFVTLRCMSLNPDSGDCRLFAGGGITALSEPVSEWREVNAKVATLSEALDISLTNSINSNKLYN